MPKQNQDELKICHVCIGDKFLKASVASRGESDRCDYCSKIRQTFPLSAIAERIDCVLRKYFQRSEVQTSNIRDVLALRTKLREGPSQRVIDLVCEIAGIPQEISKDIISRLARLIPNKRLEIETRLNPYKCDVLYVLRKPNAGNFRIIWSDLQDELKYRKRFFSTTAPQNLSDLFGDLASYRTTDDEPVIREFGPNTDATFVWRARHVTSMKDVERILKSPNSSLSSPPPRNATAGRMNPPGVPVFYGAMEKCTAISEIRPDVGSWVIVGKFEFIRDTRILDLSALANIAILKSYFDPDYEKEYGRMQFFKWFAEEIAKPIDAGDKYVDYISTQFIAEYLANAMEMRLDGIMFSSAQSACSGINIILFNHARLVRQSSNGDAVIDPEVYVIPADSNDELNQSHQIYINDSDLKNFDGDDTDHVSDQVRREHEELPTLRLIRNSLEVSQVSGVSYALEQLDVLNYVDWKRVY